MKYLHKCKKCGLVGKFLVKPVMDTYCVCRRCGDIVDLRGKQLEFVDK